jgi:hypothetical protein
VNPLLRDILESKRRMRQHQAALPFAEKLAILEKMRERRRLIAASPLRQTTNVTAKRMR